jgi:hypothetical protein
VNALYFLRRYGIAALCLVAAVVISRSSLDPQQYFRYGDKPALPIRDPTGTVAFVVGVISLEGGILYLLLRPWQAGWPWPRALVALLIFTAWLWLCSVVVVHAPGYVLLHAVWVFALVVFLAANFLGSLLWSLSRHNRSSASSATVAG